MKVLELYSGSRSIGKLCDFYGFECFSVDWENYPGTNLVTDIEFLTLDMLPSIPDMVWDSRDCTTYTIAAISHHRNGILPKSDYAKKCDRTNRNTNNLISDLLFLNPNLKFFIENPRGMMRKMPFMQDFKRTTVTYCQYGDTRMKPTDIWSNHFYSEQNPLGWKPKPICKNGDNCHVSAPRGSRTGTQGRKGSFERSRIPEPLCDDILFSVSNYLSASNKQS